MRNPEKTVPIPEKLNEWAPRPPPEFVRDVMGSSAGAGSGEFHVYRHLRRREYQRQDFMDAMAEKQRLDEEFQKKLERNKMIAEEQTAKRRRKRYSSWLSVSREFSYAVERGACECHAALLVSAINLPGCLCWAKRAGLYELKFPHTPSAAPRA
uniref:PRKR interacting protein 1 n=1 Tax=Ficedula albicollis TaxID=59894 RepID=A0A803WBA6_FICAL